MYENYLNAFIVTASDGLIKAEVKTETMEEKLSAAVGAVQGTVSRESGKYPSDLTGGGGLQQMIDSYKPDSD